MRRFALIAAFAFLASFTGCASPAQFVDRTQTGGTVVVPSYAHREEGIALIKREIGPNYQITDEKAVDRGSDTKTISQVGVGSIFTRMESWFTGTKEVAATETKTVPVTEYRITYIKTTPAPPSESAPPAATIVKTKYLPSSSP